MIKYTFLLLFIASGLIWSGCKKHADVRDPYIGDYYGYTVFYYWVGSSSKHDTTYVKVSVNKNKEYPYIDVNYPGQSSTFKVSSGGFQKASNTFMSLTISSDGGLNMHSDPVNLSHNTMVTASR
jgi:hypothetical protein